MTRPPLTWVSAVSSMADSRRAMDSVAQISNEGWLGRLRVPGEEAKAAHRELHAFLVRGLRSALARWRLADAMLEDFAQEGMLRVLAHLDEFRGDSAFASWALAIAVRVAFSELRRARWRDVSLDALTSDLRGGEITLLEPTGEAPTPERAAARAQVLAALGKVMWSDLTARQRQLIAAELRGMPQEEIAAQMGSNRNALYKLGHDARLKLQRGLERLGLSADQVLWAFDE
jgi:RNA polymerase sigma-70 factor, ECF subfamily